MLYTVVLLYSWLDVGEDDGKTERVLKLKGKNMFRSWPVSATDISTKHQR